MGKRLTLVTGGLSPLGQGVIKQLLNKGYAVRALVAPTKAQKASELDSLGAQVLVEDLGRRFALAEALKDCTNVIHLEHFYSFLKSDRDAIYRCNLEHTGHLLTAAREANIKRFVLRGSVFALGSGSPAHPANEECEWNLGSHPLEVVHAFRLAELEALRQGTLGLGLVISTPTFLIGPGIRNAITPWLKKALRGESIFLPDVRISVVDVRDAASGIVKCLELGTNNHRYLLSGHQSTLPDLVKHAATHGPPGHILPLPGPVAVKMAQALSLLGKHQYRLGLLATDPWIFEDLKARKELGHNNRPLIESLDDWWKDLSAD